MRILRSVIPAFAFLVNLCTPDLLLAAESSSYKPNTAAGAAFWSTFLIVFLSRKRAIGGWLLLFYVQTYGGILFTLIMLPSTLSDLDPSDWESTKNYIFYLISLLPILIYLLVEAIVATRLLFHRNQASVNFFKKLLIAGLAIFGLSLTIDLTVLKEESMIIRSVMSLIFTAVWTLYIWTSRRVDWVLANDYVWDYEAFKKGLPVAKRQSKKISSEKEGKLSIVSDAVIVTSKKCPFCAETIEDNAYQCPHCAFDLRRTNNEQGT